MKKKVLIVSHSYFMLLSAIQLKLTVLKDSDVDIIITDYSNNSNVICRNLSETNIFHKVIHSPVKHIYKGGNLAKKVFKTLRIFENEQTVKKRFSLDKLDYDELFISTIDIIANQLFKAIKKNNNKLVCNRYEEGYSTYTIQNDYKILEKITSLISVIDKKFAIVDSIQNLYLFDPELYVQKNNYKLKKIPSLSRGDLELKKVINSTFGYDDTKNDFNSKYIIFEESFVVEKEPIPDYDIFKEIIEILGKENVTLKLHPRNPQDRFSKCGYKVSTVKDVPWEIIQFNNDFRDKVLITISSGSTINSKSFFEEPIRTIALFKCIKPTPRLITPDFLLYIDRMQQKYGKGELAIPESKEQLYEELV
ncbi:hypothetical protein P5491_004155 [Priestia megaterium]|uniref:hypothetical protein n=1 Tax=Priestia megaterium TaxID=1404 RepID=UPI003CE6A5F9